MSCYHPRPAYEHVDPLSGEVVVSLWSVPPGRRALRFFKLPCNQCIGCRESYSLNWARRCENESLFHKESCFLTLTVSDDNIESVFPGRSLRYEPFQKFIRSLRKRLSVPVRFFMCGEYGDLLSRPHFHSVIFGWYPSISDRVFYKKTSVGDLYISKLVTELWPFGFNTVAYFSTYCAQYVAGYITKKINGKLKASHYGKLTPEFSRMSLKPGIGSKFYHSFKRDIYDGKDALTLPSGQVVPPGRYYDKLHLQYHPEHMAKVKARRAEPDAIRDFLSSPDQLRAKEVNHRSRRKAGRNNFIGGVQ